MQKGLAGKVGLKKDVEVADLPVKKELIEPIIAALLQDNFQSTLSQELPYHQQGSPFLQTMLLALQTNRWLSS